MATVRAAGVGKKLSIVKASLTFLPRTVSNTSPTFRGDTLICLALAVTSISGTYPPDCAGAAGAAEAAGFLIAVTLSALPVCPLKVLVGANSPNLWPTIFSVMKIGTCRLPSCTPIVSPII